MLDVGPPALTGPQTPGTRANTASTAWPIPVVLRFGGQAVTATLTDTPPSRQLAAMLPLTLHLTDAWGQAKAGPLPHPLDGGTPSTTRSRARSTSGPPAR
ncbi:cyclophilin-like fold protein [Nonomuraea thailandensis]